MEYAEYKNNEGIWEHFLREKDGQSGQCKLCKNKLKTVGGSTKRLHGHLRRKQDLSVLKRKVAADSAKDDEAATTSQPQPKRQTVAAKPKVGPMTKHCLNMMTCDIMI